MKTTRKQVDALAAGYAAAFRARTDIEELGRKLRVIMRRVDAIELKLNDRQRLSEELSRLSGEAQWFADRVRGSDKDDHPMDNWSLNKERRQSRIHLRLAPCTPIQTDRLLGAWTSVHPSKLWIHAVFISFLVDAFVVVLLARGKNLWTNLLLH
jgi:hypothetical protein